MTTLYIHSSAWWNSCKIRNIRWDCRSWAGTVIMSEVSTMLTSSCSLLEAWGLLLMSWSPFSTARQAAEILVKLMKTRNPHVTWCIMFHPIYYMIIKQMKIVSSSMPAFISSLNLCQPRHRHMMQPGITVITLQIEQVYTWLGSWADSR